MFFRLKGPLLLAGALCLALTVQGSAHQSKNSLPPKASRKAQQKRLAALKAMPPVRGVVFHCCSCSVPCPCMFNGKDVEGCNIVRIYHITDGGYEGKDLVGLTVVLIPHPDDLKKQAGSLRKEGKPVDAAIYLPTGMTEHQQRGIMGLLAENNFAVGMNTQLVRHVPISFRKMANGYDVEIPHVFHARTQSVLGRDEKPIMLENLALSEGSRWYLGRSSVHDYQDKDEKAWNWKFPQSNGSWTFFAWGPHIDPSEEPKTDE